MFGSLADHLQGAYLFLVKGGFGGLVVSTGSRVRGFDPDRCRWIFFRCEKILSMPSFGGEVK
jgi:hypothetical protein